MQNNREDTNSLTGVVLMTYGSATVAENVREYLGRIYSDRASEETIKDFENRYRLVGHSPLVKITQQQAALTQEMLGKSFIVRAGMRHSEPSIKEAVAECKAAGGQRLIGIILSPQFSSFIMEGYKTAFIAAAQEYGFDKQKIMIAAPWPTQEDFIALTAAHIEEAQEKNKQVMPVIFTTHSLPQRVVEKDPTYLKQLEATTSAILAQLNDPELSWSTAYQSAGHTPELWLKPDLTEMLEQLAARGEKSVLIVPIQFLADHLEVLYDLDIAAKMQCQERGIAYHRIELPNDHPRFAHALAAIAEASMLNS